MTEVAGALSVSERADAVWARIQALEPLLTNGPKALDPNSALAVNDKELAPLVLSSACHLGVLVAVDHLRAFRLVSHEGLPALAGYSLLRAALEAAAQVIWLLLPNDASKRGIRLVQAAWADSEDLGNIYDEVTGKKLNRQARHSRILMVGARYGLDHKGIKRAPSTTQKFRSLDRFLNSGEVEPSANYAALWRGLSAAAHGKSHAVELLMKLEPSGSSGSPGHTQYSANADLAQLIADSVTGFVEMAEKLYAKRAAATDENGELPEFHD